MNIEKMVLNMALKSMKDNFLSLDDEMKQKEFNKLLDENQELKTKIKELVKYAYGTEMSLGEFKGFYKLAIGKEYEPKKGIKVE